MNWRSRVDCITPLGSRLRACRVSIFAGMTERVGLAERELRVGVIVELQRGYSLAGTPSGVLWMG